MASVSVSFSRTTKTSKEFMLLANALTALNEASKAHLILQEGVIFVAYNIWMSLKGRGSGGEDDELVGFAKGNDFKEFIMLIASVLQLEHCGLKGSSKYLTSCATTVN